MKNYRSHGWLLILLLSGCRSAGKPLETQPLAAGRKASTEVTVPARAAPHSESVDEASERPAQPVQLAAFQIPNPDAPPLETLPAVQPDVQPLGLDDVTRSLIASFPGIQVAMRELDIARGRETAAWGEFDLKLKGEHTSTPEGFYDNYRNLVKVEQATMPGGSVYGQYRIGDGSFPVWYGERETNEGGEFKIGFMAALLRDRAIDQRRAAIFIAQLQQRQVDPAVRSLLLEFVLAASDAYWSWVAAGQALRVNQNLLQLTMERNRIYEIRVENKDLAPLELLQNRRLIAARQTKLTETERKLQQSAIKVSYFYRDATGRPLIPPLDRIPREFPKTDFEFRADPATDIQVALDNRPELQELRILRQQVSVDYNLARNQYLPAVNAGLDASKDVGAPASSKGDKTPFELEAGLFVDVPYQRRKSIGKMRESQAKMSQLAAKMELTSNKIEVQVRDAHSAIITARQRVEQARESRELAEKLVDAERLRFENSDSDLFRVALQESVAVEAALLEIEALADYQKALAAYRAAMAITPE